MKPTGPHPVGVADVAMRAPQLVVPAAPNVKRVAGRLFYPCKKSWTAPVSWIPHSNYARGYIGFLFRFVPKKTLQAQVARPLLTAIGWALGTSRTLPVYYQAPAADAGSLGQRLPVVVLSHGLSGTRNAYSSICIELASQGYVVLAIEHGDGSASTARLPRLAPADRAAAAAALKAAAAAAAPPAARTSASSSTTLSPAVYAGARLAGRAIRTGAPPTANCVPAMWSYDDGNGNGVANGGGGGDEVAAKETEGSEAKVEAAKGHGVVEASNGGGNGGGSGSGANGNGSADGSEWYFYGGLGDDEEQRLKTEHRLGEVAAALQVMEAVDAGVTEGLLELPRSVASTLAGRLDLGRAAVVGHSYGGATAAAAAACLDRFQCAVALDPWWDCFPESLPVTSPWPRPTPLLVVGSHDWNTPNAAGKLACGGENQQRVFAAAAAGGGGVLHAVPRGSSHSNFDDVLLLYGRTLTWVLQALDFKTALEPAKGHAINMWCITRFLDRHLPRPAAPDQQGRQGHAQGPAAPLTEEDLQAFREGVGADCETLIVRPGVVAAKVTAGARG